MPKTKNTISRIYSGYFPTQRRNVVTLLTKMGLQSSAKSLRMMMMMMLKNKFVIIHIIIIIVAVPAGTTFLFGRVPSPAPDQHTLIEAGPQLFPGP